MTPGATPDQPANRSVGPGGLGRITHDHLVRGIVPSSGLEDLQGQSQTQPNLPDLGEAIPGPLHKALIGEGYRPYKVLAKGGMGTVCLALDARSAGDLPSGIIGTKTVVVKVISPNIRGNAEQFARAAARFRQEAAIANQLSGRHGSGSEHIIFSFGVVEAPSAKGDAPHLALVQEFFVDSEQEGATTLQAIIDEVRNSTSFRQNAGHWRSALNLMLTYFRQAAAAVAFMHRQRIVHMDIKPDNILIADHRAKVMDFGISRAMGEMRTVAGTPGFAPNEQLMGGIVDARTDVRALGATLYYILTGEHPTSHLGSSVTFSDLTALPPRRARFGQHKIPRALLDIAFKAMAPDPADRYQTVDALLTDIDRAERLLPITASTDRLQTPKLFVQRHWSAVNAAAWLGLCWTLVQQGLSWKETATRNEITLQRGEVDNRRIYGRIDAAIDALQRGDPRIARTIIDTTILSYRDPNDYQNSKLLSLVGEIDRYNSLLCGLQSLVRIPTGLSGDSSEINRNAIATLRALLALYADHKPWVQDPFEAVLPEQHRTQVTHKSLFTDVQRTTMRNDYFAISEELALRLLVGWQDSTPTESTLQECEQCVTGIATSLANLLRHRIALLRGTTSKLIKIGESVPRPATRTDAWRLATGLHYIEREFAAALPFYIQSLLREN